MKRYEGLFILNTAGKEETIKDMIEKITADVSATGAKVETVQKMDKKSFSRVADRKYSAGYYLNIIFEADAAILTALRHRFANNEDVFRVMFSNAPVVIKAEAKEEVK